MEQHASSDGGGPASVLVKFQCFSFQLSTSGSVLAWQPVATVFPVGSDISCVPDKNLYFLFGTWVQLMHSWLVSSRRSSSFPAGTREHVGERQC